MVLEQYIANGYVRALVVFILFFLVIRVLLFFGRKIILSIALRTKSDLDDKLIAAVTHPLTFIAFLFSFRIAIEEIALSDALNAHIVTILYTLFIVVIAYLAFEVMNTVVVDAARKMAKRTKSQIDDSLISLSHSVMQIALIAFSALYILSVWGIEITPLLAGLGIAGIAVALALQPILSNIFSGASVVLDHSVRVGDLVYLENGSIKGKIVKVGLRSTHINTFDNELMIVPNTKLAEGVIQNIALPEPKTRVVIPFSVAYGSDIEKVKALVLKEIKKIAYSEKDPEPHIKFDEMAHSSLNFNAYFYVSSFEHRLSAKDEANTRIYNALNKAGISIPFPQMDVHVKK